MNADVLRLMKALSLFTGVGLLIFVYFLFIQPETKPLPPAPSVTQTPTPSFCGGIAGIACPTGMTCKLDGNYPDAGGTCIKHETSTPPKID